MSDNEFITGRVDAQIAQGCWIIEQDQTRDGIFCHQRNVIKRKFLRPDDRVRFRIVASPRKPGEVEAADVEIIGHTVAMQRNGGAS
jgi:hypothetical protein